MKIKRVRIAVAIDDKGRWNACGWFNGKKPEDDKTLMRDALDPLDYRDALHEHVIWVEADVPIPTVEEHAVEGEAVQISD